MWEFMCKKTPKVGKKPQCITHLGIMHQRWKKYLSSTQSFYCCYLAIPFWLGIKHYLVFNEPFSSYEINVLLL